MEKLDKLEKFVQDKRADFDDREPSGALWDKINKDLDPLQVAKPRPTYHMVWKVAAVFFFVATSVLAVMQWKSNTEQIADNSAVNNEFVMAEQYYMQLISKKKGELDQSASISPELGEKFAKDLEMLDSLYLQLKAETKQVGDQTMLQDAMVQNLRLRIEILNYQLEILENIKTVKENENEANI